MVVQLLLLIYIYISGSTAATGGKVVALLVLVGAVVMLNNCYVSSTAILTGMGLWSARMWSDIAGGDW
jgi:hypothetical protein